MSFARDIKKWSKKTNKSAEELVTATLLKLNELVIYRTPVKWGRAVGGWVATTGAANMVDTGTLDPGRAATLTKANATAMNAYGKVYFLANNVEYIGALEYDGHSKQAPHGMARISVEQIKNELRQKLA